MYCFGSTSKDTRPPRRRRLVEDLLVEKCGFQARTSAFFDIDFKKYFSYVVGSTRSKVILWGDSLIGKA